jgi:ATP-dependent Clp protease ATP-binding subunit ClpA
LGQTRSRPAIGFGQVAGDERPPNPEQAVRSAFRPEFFNRLDAVVAFNPLSSGDVAKIAELMLAQVKARLASQDIELVITPEAVAWICAQQLDASLGARPMRRTIEQVVENPLAAMLVRSELKSGERLEISVLNQTLFFSVTKKGVGG